MTHSSLRVRCLSLLVSTLALAGCGVEDDAFQAPGKEEGREEEGGEEAQGALTLGPGTTFTQIGPLDSLNLRCSTAQMCDILAPATADNPRVDVTCNFTMPAAGTLVCPGTSSVPSSITKKVRFRGAVFSRTFDCKGSWIAPSRTEGGSDSVQFSSVKSSDGSWARPQLITVRNCSIMGSVRLLGMTIGSVDITASSRSTGHTARAQAAAPLGITLNAVKIQGTGRVPLYLGHGVTHMSLIDSEITGSSLSAAVYLDAESGRNYFYGNYIHPSTARELIAVDGSAYNRFISNRFSSLENGGIYLYRNCGERGTIRHQAPSYNAIINNHFYYDKYTGSNPAILVNSRNGSTGNIFGDAFPVFGTSYCTEDETGLVIPGTSTWDDDDHGQYNVIAENQIAALSPSKMIRVDPSAGDPPNSNILAVNQTVSARVNRSAGCGVFLPAGPVYVPHGSHASRRTSTTEGQTYPCSDGGTTTTAKAALTKVPFSCSVSGNNAGCSTVVSCGSGRRVVGVRSVCDLENGAAITDAQLAARPWDTIFNLRGSDLAEGTDEQPRYCGLAWLTPWRAYGASTVGYIHTHEVNAAIMPATNPTLFTASCREHDANGGDCSVRGEALCH